MTRKPVDVVPLTPELIPDLMTLWAQARADATTRDSTPRLATPGRVAGALARPEVHARIARYDGIPVGFVVATEELHGLSEHREVTIQHLYVARDGRRSGVARALLACIVTLAERRGSDLVACHAPAQSRESNRFFARLGFGSVVVRRVVPTATLRRRVSPEPTATSQLLRARRSLRARAGLSERQTA